MNRSKLTMANPEVLVTTDPITHVNREDIQWLKTKAAENPRQRIRLCAHISVDDAVHEMLIVHTKITYNQPHKHPNKSESYHLIEGELDIVIFDEAGEVLETVRMGEYASDARFYWRLSESHYHMVIPRSEVVVFHEITSGPFDRATSFVPAPWSPEDEETADQERFLARVEERLRLFKISGEDNGQTNSK